MWHNWWLRLKSSNVHDQFLLISYRWLRLNLSNGHCLLLFKIWNLSYAHTRNLHQPWTVSRSHALSFPRTLVFSFSILSSLSRLSSWRSAKRQYSNSYFSNIDFFSFFFGISWARLGLNDYACFVFDLYWGFGEWISVASNRSLPSISETSAIGFNSFLGFGGYSHSLTYLLKNIWTMCVLMEVGYFPFVLYDVLLWHCVVWLVIWWFSLIWLRKLYVS